MNQIKFQDSIFTVGSSKSGPSANSTEIMDVKTWEWSTRKPYPFASRIQGARSLYYKDLGSFLVFGGELVNDRLTRIASYVPTTDSWSEVGLMRSGRSWTSVIHHENEFLIIGGYDITGDKQSEKFNLTLSEYQAPYMPDLCNFLNSYNA